MWSWLRAMWNTSYGSLLTKAVVLSHRKPKSTDVDYGRFRFVACLYFDHYRLRNGHTTLPWNPLCLTPYEMAVFCVERFYDCKTALIVVAFSKIPILVRPRSVVFSHINKTDELYCMVLRCTALNCNMLCFIVLDCISLYWIDLRTQISAFRSMFKQQ